MKKIALSFILVSFSLSTLFAQSSVWKIAGKGTEIYIGGSIHLLREQDYPLPEEFNRAFNLSDILVLETDIGGLEKPANAERLMQKVMYKDGRTLESVLNENNIAELEKEFKNYGIPLAGMNQFKPAMAIMTLTLMELQKKGVTATGVDKHFYEQAEKRNKPILFLETVEEQMNLIGTMGEGQENKFVEYSLKDLKETGKMFEDLIDSWKGGTTALMEEQIKEFKRDFPEVYHSMLVERNQSWMPKIESYFETEEKEFVIVGTGHLYGTNGILQAFKNSGYKVRQL